MKFNGALVSTAFELRDRLALARKGRQTTRGWKWAKKIEVAVSLLMKPMQPPRWITVNGFGRVELLTWRLDGLYACLATIHQVENYLKSQGVTLPSSVDKPVSKVE